MQSFLVWSNRPGWLSRLRQWRIHHMRVWTILRRPRRPSSFSSDMLIWNNIDDDRQRYTIQAKTTAAIQLLMICEPLFKSYILCRRRSSVFVDIVCSLFSLTKTRTTTMPSITVYSFSCSAYVKRRLILDQCTRIQTWHSLPSCIPREPRTTMGHTNYSPMESSRFLQHTPKLWGLEFGHHRDM